MLRYLIGNSRIKWYLNQIFDQLNDKNAINLTKKGPALLRPNP